MKRPSADLKTVVDYLDYWTERQPHQTLYRFLDIAGEERESYSYEGFDERTRELAGHLVGREGLERGDRVLLVYPPGLELIAAFFACVRAGIIAIPVYPPTPLAFQAGLAKLAYISRDGGARAALTTQGFYRSYRLLLAKRRIASLWRKGPALPDLKWIATDATRGRGAERVPDDPSSTLFLQYTSGSTSDPKGVVVTQENVISNGHAILEHRPIGVSWLPQYHDMGFIGYYLYPMITGGMTHGFSPLDFLKRPALWLRTISEAKGTITSAPNFAYDYCLRADKVDPAEIEGVDLSSLQVLMTAAEPVRASTYERFLERFSPYGLRAEAFHVAYGLAENTLAVTSYGRQILTANKKHLQAGTLRLETHEARNLNQVRLVSCGQALEGNRIRIVDPESRLALPEHGIGEIWIDGESKCEGYYRRPELSEEAFRARIVGEEDEGDGYLRTGDLGFLHEGELFVCGRLKDMIIIRGVNYYPQDIEAIVEESSSQIRKGCTAAFSVDREGEVLVVVTEVRNPKNLPAADEIARSIRTQYYIEPHTIAFLPPRTIPKTTSGKISRSQVKQRFVDGTLPLLDSHVSEQETPIEMTGLRERFSYIVEVYNITGREDYSFADLGIDSITMVQLLSDVKGLLEEHGAGELVREVDVPLLQRLKIAEFYELLDQFEKGSEEPIPALRKVIRQVREEHVALERDSMRADSEFSLPASASTESGPEISQVLVTGSTGFFGPFLLRSLLERTAHTYHLLTRATDPVHGMDRLRASLRRARLWTPALDDLLQDRVRIVCGDLARDRLGLTRDRWEELAGQVQAILHNGAMVNYLMSYDSLKPHNVDGTHELLRLAFAGRRKDFHLVSSTFIFGWSVKKLLLESDHNPDMANLDFGYAQTKWVQEQLVLAAQEKGLNVRIYRPSLISASSNGVGSRDDIAVRLLAFMVRYGVAVSALNQISFLPADLVADNLVALFNQDDARQTAFHITVDEYYNLRDVTETISRLYGYSFEYYDIPAFIRQMERLSTKDDPIYPLVDFFVRSQDKLVAMKDKRYNNDGFRRERERAGGAGGEPPLDETVTFIMEHMLSEGIITREPPARPATRGAPPLELPGAGPGRATSGAE
jgi:thioester reductase-like protein